MTRNSIESTLIQFINTGQLGPITLAMKQEEVHALLGEPDTILRSNINTIDLQYGNLSLVFSPDGEMLLIGIDFRRASYGLPLVLDVEWFQDLQTWTATDFLVMLTEANCQCGEDMMEWAEDVDVVNKGRRFYVGDAQVEAIFEENIIKLHHSGGQRKTNLQDCW